ncbi:hypothetical protein M9H77_33000 [Catharanthus roseus]|uniref:Uncharacterized protein n=1 Tax=Catharanthus roseus TaxID=4058 RepID=A0ACC0A4I3_CATRO|nr:hypothetical protein M9H77_33000 [Catharanthus roseus]
MVNEEKDKRKRSLTASSRRHVRTRDSNDGNNKVGGCDIQFMGTEHIPIEERIEMPKSRIVQNRDIEILEPPELKKSSRSRKKDSKDGNNEDRSCDQNQQKHKDIIGPGHEEELRGKAKMLNEEKDKRKRSLRTSSRRHIRRRNSNDGNNEMDGCDIEFMGIEHVPVEQRI